MYYKSCVSDVSVCFGRCCVLVVVERLGHGFVFQNLFRCRCFGHKGKGLVSPHLLFDSLFSCVAGLGISSGFSFVSGARLYTRGCVLLSWKLCCGGWLVPGVGMLVLNLSGYVICA